MLILAVFTVEVVALVFALTKLVGILAEYRKGEQTYVSLSETSVTDLHSVEIEPEVEIEAEEEGPNPEEDVLAILVEESPPPEESVPPEAIPEEAPVSEVPIQVDWKKLKKTNTEIVGWLYCADTPINYPVVQAKNNEYYLTHDAAKNDSECGALFLDMRNNLSSEHDNLIIYGHRMNDNSMFGTLHRFARKTFYEKHPVLYFLTPDQNYCFEILGCRTVRAEEKYYQTQFATDKEYENYITSIRYQSYYATDVSIADGTRIATLSTCTKYRGINDPRIQLCGVLVPVT